MYRGGFSTAMSVKNCENLISAGEPEDAEFSCCRTNLCNSADQVGPVALTNAVIIVFLIAYMFS